MESCAERYTGSELWYDDRILSNVGCISWNNGSTHHTAMRVYVVPEAWDTPGSSTTMPETELWCFSCRSMYPNQLTED